MSAESRGQGTEADARPEGRRDHRDGALILVVDDDKMNRVVMSAVLRQLGYRYHLVVNGREAVEAVQREPYDAVLMDCLMPEMDGYEATATIRRHERLRLLPRGRRRVPIIAVTAVAIQGAREQCIASGMDDYLTKPIVLQSVSAVLDRWLTSPEADATWAPELADQAEEPDDAVNPEALDALRLLDPEAGETLVTEVVRDFSTEVGPAFGPLREAVVAGNVEQFVHQLHFIAGCASIVGATHVERLARTLENAPPVAADGTLAGAEAQVERLEEAFTRARIALEAMVALSSMQPPPATG